MKYDLLSIGQRRAIALCGSNIYPTPDFHPDRTMAEHDLLYMVNGEWSICQDDENYQLSAGDLMFLHAGSHHYSLSRCTPNTQTMYIHFSALPSDQYGVEISTESLSQYISGDTVCIPTVTPCRQQSSIRRYMRNVIEQFWSNREDRERHMSILLELLLNEIFYYNRENQMLHEDWIVQLLREMRTNPSHMYTLDEIAEIAGMSVRTLSTRFKRATGQSVYQYQLNLKLDMAFALIRSEPQRTLSDLALNFGFYDAYQFSKLFKRKFGASPKYLRQANTVK